MDATYSVQMLVDDEEKKMIEELSEVFGLSQSQLALVALHGFLAMYEEKKSFLYVDLVLPTKKSRTKRIKVNVTHALKEEIEKVSEELNFSQSQILLSGVLTFYHNYKKTGNMMLKDMLSPMYRA